MTSSELTRNRSGKTKSKLKIKKMATQGPPSAISQPQRTKLAATIEKQRVAKLTSDQKWTRRTAAKFSWITTEAFDRLSGHPDFRTACCGTPN